MLVKLNKCTDIFILRVTDSSKSAPANPCTNKFKKTVKSSKNKEIKQHGIKAISYFNAKNKCIESTQNGSFIPCNNWFETNFEQNGGYPIHNAPQDVSNGVSPLSAILSGDDDNNYGRNDALSPPQYDLRDFANIRRNNC